MKGILVRACLGISLASPLAAQAAANDPGLHFMLSTGLTGKGDTIYTVDYTNGDSHKIRAGSLIQLGTGLVWQSATLPLAAAFTANYHFDRANGWNGSVKFERVPLEAIAYYTGLPRWRFGGGVRFVQSPRYEYDVNDDDVQLKFKDTAGAVLEAGYNITPNMWINLRLVSEKYKPTSVRINGVTSSVGDIGSYDGSHAGVNVVFQF